MITGRFVHQAWEEANVINKLIKYFGVALGIGMILVFIHLLMKIFLFSMETRNLDSIVEKHENLSSLRIALEEQNYYCLDNYKNEHEQLVMTVSYKNERPFIDAAFMLYDLRFRITPAWFVVYADKNGNTLKTEYAGGIVF